jgi:hypothetical protein
LKERPLPWHWLTGAVFGVNFAAAMVLLGVEPYPLAPASG